MCKWELGQHKRDVRVHSIGSRYHIADGLTWFDLGLIEDIEDIEACGERKRDQGDKEDDSCINGRLSEFEKRRGIC